MPMPQAIAPMLAKAGPLPREGAAYGYEVKWDGVRAVVRLDAGRAAVMGRNGTDFTERYPEVSALAADQRGRRLVLDGELVAFDAAGRPSFERLQSRMHLASPAAVSRRTGDVPVTYVVFDVLWMEGHSTLELPYRDRRRLLAGLELEGPSWRTPAHREGDGAALKRATEEQGIEGIVAKRLESAYEPGRRSAAWIKVKNLCVQEFVVGGFTPGTGHRAGHLGALVVGVYGGEGGHQEGGGPRVGGRGGLRYVGKVGSGFTEGTLAAVVSALQGRRSAASPFEGRPPPREATFVTPSVVVKVEFREWTASGTLRHPTFRGLVPDAHPRAVVRET